MQDKWIAALKQIVPTERVSTNESVLRQHSMDESYHEPRLPHVVVFPERTEEVSRVMAFAHEQSIPVVPFGLGSSLEGHVIPLEGGISLDFSLMNRVLDVRAHDFLVTVQPGVTRSQLNQELKKHGLFFSVDPGADATLGGMAATNASGTTSVRYGIMRDQVRGMEVVLASGETIRTGSAAAKSSAGYHLPSLFVGSEGTLGVFTELTLRVYGIPETIVAARAMFPSVEDCVQAVLGILSAGIPIARMELIDAHSIEALNRFSQTDYAVQPTLFLEFHGNEAGLEHDVDFAQAIMEDCGCQHVDFETDARARNRLWDARHQLAYAFVHGNPGKKLMVTDVCLPLSELPDAIHDARVGLEELGVTGGIVGHVGDGNYHVIIMMDVNNPRDVERVEAFTSRIVQFALDKGGTCTGEHGVGIGKKKFMRTEHGPSLDIMRAIKRAVDPKGILNPGKVI